MVNSFIYMVIPSVSLLLQYNDNTLIITEMYHFIRICGPGQNDFFKNHCLNQPEPDGLSLANKQ